MCVCVCVCVYVCVCVCVCVKMPQLFSDCLKMFINRAVNVTGASRCAGGRVGKWCDSWVDMHSCSVTVPRVNRMHDIEAFTQ